MRLLIGVVVSALTIITSCLAQVKDNHICTGFWTLTTPNLYVPDHTAQNLVAWSFHSSRTFCIHLSIFLGFWDNAICIQFTSTALCLIHRRNLGGLIAPSHTRFCSDPSPTTFDTSWLPAYSRHDRFVNDQSVCEMDVVSLSCCRPVVRFVCDYECLQ